MNTIRITETFADWLSGLKDGEARARITARLKRAADGNLGDVKPTSEAGVSEMRLDFGLGYRPCFTLRGKTLARDLED